MSTTFTGLGLGARRFRAERPLTRTRWSPAESLCHLGIRSSPLCKSGCDACVLCRCSAASVCSRRFNTPPCRNRSWRQWAPDAGAQDTGRNAPWRLPPRWSLMQPFCVSNGPPVLVRGLSRCRELSPVLRGHVDVVRALAPARRTDRLNPVHVLHSRRDVRVRERDRRALRVRHVLQQPVLT